MGMRMPETCWSVSKRQAINFVKLLHLIGWFSWKNYSTTILLVCWMVHLPKFRSLLLRIVSVLCVISLTLVLTSHMMPEVSVNRTKSCVHVSAMRTKTDEQENHDGRCFHCCSCPVKPGSELGWSSWGTILSVSYHLRSVIGSRDLWFMPCIE